MNYATPHQNRNAQIQEIRAKEQALLQNINCEGIIDFLNYLATLPKINLVKKLTLQYESLLTLKMMGC